MILQILHSHGASMPEFRSQIPKKRNRCGQRGELYYMQLNILEAIDGFGSLPVLCNYTSSREVVAIVGVEVIILIIIQKIPR